MIELIKKTTKLRKYLIDHSEEFRIKNLNGDNSKLYTGELSPGCKCCIDGTWACIFINGLCTRKCFFCPQNRMMKKERKIILCSIKFDHIDDCIDFLDKFNYQGVGFSGGEPFMVFDLLIKFILKIRERFGKKMYIWLYTNGDLVTNSKLRMLKEAGLNEIRFDLSARKFDLKPIKLAKEIIGNVTIETPAVPEEEKDMIYALDRMKSLGIKSLNLHELFTTEFNRKAFDLKRYSYKKNSAVYESDMTGMKIFKYIVKNKINIHINYCTTRYKEIYQKIGELRNFSKHVKKTFESITSLGLIRQIYICPDKIWLENFLKKFKLRDDYHWNKMEKKLYLGSDILITLNKLQFINQNIYINYIAVKQKNYSKKIEKSGETVKINKNFNIVVLRKKPIHFSIKQNELIELFINIFLCKQSLPSIIKQQVDRKKLQHKQMELDSYKQLLNNILLLKQTFMNIEYLGKDKETN